MTDTVVNWTNESVIAFAEGSDPVEKIKSISQSLVLKAFEKGWEGPPFNPLFIAEMLDVQIEANSSIADARLIETQVGARIEFNPQQIRERVRFSIAHEVAHLLFPDWNKRIRNRGGDEYLEDGWQLEMLCNIAASEFVLPIGSLAATPSVPSIENLMLQCRQYDVSAEAFLIRLAKVSDEPICVFFSSPFIRERVKRLYRIDYFISSPSATHVKISQRIVPIDSVIPSCTAIGHTARAVEGWIIDAATAIECVGIPAYPGSIFPRVATLVRLESSGNPSSQITYLHGDVLQPQGNSPKILCQLVNDRAKKWGGGVARKTAYRFPEAEDDFARSLFGIPRKERLGQVIFSKADKDITIASLIAQEGFGPSLFPRIRYQALERCLATVTAKALRSGASIHMPRIGTGAAGGEWAVVEEMLGDTMVRSGLSVTIYEAPPKRLQLELF
ncbi:MAG: hypothetical protein OXG16_10175 [Rhodospirillales bacterium]|nr:hypothetical protein [Rhodospirillales bacterium]